MPTKPLSPCVIPGATMIVSRSAKMSTVAPVSPARAQLRTRSRTREEPFGSYQEHGQHEQVDEEVGDLADVGEANRLDRCEGEGSGHGAHDTAEAADDHDD